MWRKFCKSKIHMATVTKTLVFYEGSITIDAHLMEAADIQPYEAVDVWNVSSGDRFSTYAIPAPRGSGEICVNGAAARRASVGDQVIIAAFAWVEDGGNLEPAIVFVDERNKIKPMALRELHNRVSW